MDCSDAPQVLRDFLTYHETICGHSKATVDQYYLDLRMFLRFLKLDRGLAPRTAELDEISIADVDISFLRAVTLTEVYSFLAYLSRDRVKQPNAHELEYGLSANSRARKIAAIRSFFKYLTVKAKLLEENPVQDLDSPKIPKTLPHYLTLEESKRLLSVVDGKNKERDYCILCIFLNCGLRISELVGLNLQDDHGDSLRILGKGSKSVLFTSTMPAVKRSTVIWPYAARSHHRARQPCFSPTDAHASAATPYRSWSRKI